MTRVDVAGVTACECPSHVRAVLIDRETGRKLRVRIDAQAGQDLMLELASIPSRAGVAVATMIDALDVAGCEIECVELGVEEDAL